MPVTNVNDDAGVGHLVDRECLWSPQDTAVISEESGAAQSPLMAPYKTMKHLPNLQEMQTTSHVCNCSFLFFGEELIKTCCFRKHKSALVFCIVSVFILLLADIPWYLFYYSMAFITSVA